MAVKPLKLKRYISEEEAAQLLALLIGEEVTSDDMAQYALDGIVPAYMQFAPRDREAYPNDVFLVFDREALEMGLDGRSLRLIGNEFLAVIPYPLPSNGWVETSDGQQWRVMVDKVDGSVDEVTSEHYVRVYAPSEVCKAAEFMNDPMSCPKWPAILHECGQTWSFYDDDDQLSEPTSILSPFLGARDYIPTGTGALRRSHDKEPINWRMIVAGLLKLLEPQRLKQHQISDAIADFKLPGAGKRNVDEAMSKANEALAGPGQTKRRRKVMG